MSNFARKGCSSRALTARAKTKVIRPRADVFENQHSLAVIIELPGVKRSELEVTIEHRSLTVSGLRFLDDKRDVQLIRRFRLNEQIDTDAIEAVLEDGLLTLTLPKHVSAQPRSVPVAVV